jgi:hypothetical protein
VSNDCEVIIVSEISVQLAKIDLRGFPRSLLLSWQNPQSNPDRIPNLSTQDTEGSRE